MCISARSPYAIGEHTQVDWTRRIIEINSIWLMMFTGFLDVFRHLKDVDVKIVHISALCATIC